MTFAPYGHLKTLHFLKWLEVNFSEDAEREIFSAQSPLEKSLEFCCLTLRRILESIERPIIPKGINVESVSIKKDEIDASIELFEKLQEILATFYQSQAQNY